MNLKHGFAPEFAAVKRFFVRYEQTAWFYPALLGILCLVALLPLAIPGIPSGHDIYFHLQRIEGLAAGLSDGTFPVRIYPGIAKTGYANGLFYPDLFLYFPALLRLAGCPGIVAYKSFFVLLFLSSATSMYWCVKRISGKNFTAFAAALLYLFSSYTACDFWIRAALGEMQCFVFLPLVLLGLYRIFYKDHRQFSPLVWGMTGIAMAHVITFLITSLLIAVLCFFYTFRLLRSPRRLGSLTAAGMLTLLLTACFFLPLLEMMRSDVFYVTTSVSMSPISTRTIPLTHLLLELPYMKLEYWHPAGIGTIFGVLFFFRLRTKFPDSRRRRWQDTMLSAGVVMLLCSTSFLPWEGMFSILSTIQFPWRFYLPALSCLAVGGALAVNALCHDNPNGRFRWLIGLFIGCGIAYFLSTGYLYTAKLYERNFYYGGALPAKASITSGHYLPDGTDLKLLSQTNPNVATVLIGSAELAPLQRRNLTATLNYQEAAPGTVVEFPLIAYLGYRAELADGTILPWRISEHNKLAVPLPPDRPMGSIHVFYHGTALQRLSGWISATTLVLLLSVCFLLGKIKSSMRSDGGFRPKKV